MGEAVDRLVALSRVSGYTRKDGTFVRSYLRAGSFKGTSTGKHFAIAEDENGKNIGSLGWFTDPERRGEIFHVGVDPKHQRKGIATSLFKLAKTMEPDLHHSKALSEDAQAWIAGMKNKSRESA